MSKFKFKVWDTWTNTWENRCLIHQNGRIGVEGMSESHFIEQNEKRFIVQRFTQLNDKNNKEIFEGDVVKDLDKEFGVIEFLNGSFVLNTKNRIIPFWSVFISNGMVYPRQINTNTLEIIGNIFENPELLKQ